jgi:hypothetical protein
MMSNFVKITVTKTGEIFTIGITLDNYKPKRNNKYLLQPNVTLITSMNEKLVAHVTVGEIIIVCFSHEKHNVDYKMGD